MGIVHFLNVNEGDCHVVQHHSGHTTVIDVSNASATEEKTLAEETQYVAKSLGVSGNFNQKAHPTNPITYLENLEISYLFRYVQTHPDMDHMDGIEDLFSTLTPINFWDTDNKKEITEEFTKYKESDWKFYKKLRADQIDTKRLTLFDGSKGAYYNEDENGEGGGDGLRILAPTRALLDKCNEEEDWNDASYVILYTTNNRRILFPGDAHDDTWAHLLENHSKKLSNIDVLIAPHHGRRSQMDFSFLDVLQPRLTLFGNAKSKHLAYEKWTSRGLNYITNNQAGNIILDAGSDGDLRVYVSCQAFAETYGNLVGSQANYSHKHKAWSLLAM